MIPLVMKERGRGEQGRRDMLQNHLSQQVLQSHIKSYNFCNIYLQIYLQGSDKERGGVGVFLSDSIGNAIVQ